MDEDGGYLLFNGLRGSLIKIPKPLAPTVTSFLSASAIKHGNQTSGRKRLVAFLVEGGFLLPAGIDELKIIRDRFEAGKNTGILSLLIAPTMDCNHACIYCFQERSPLRMDGRTVDSIIAFAQDCVARDIFYGINVNWFGGEPLMEPSVIERISVGLKRLAQSKKMSYTASISTNGTLLTPSTVAMLLRHKVDSCQISLDGTQPVHDSRRPFRSGKRSSFSTIMQNMTNVIGKMAVRVRINVDEQNLDSGFALLELFKNNGFFRAKHYAFVPYMAMTGPFNTNKCFACKPLNRSAFYAANLAFQKKLVEYTKAKELRPIVDFPFFTDVPCGALEKHSYCFDPAGRYFRCGLQLGETGRECGSLNGTVNHLESEKWAAYSPFSDPECRECAFLPFCMGGCFKTRLDKNTFFEKDACAYWRDNLEALLRIYAEKASSSR